MRMWSWVGAAFILLILQTTSLGYFRGNLYFDLPLLFIYGIGLFYGPAGGLLCGLALGLLQDTAAPDFFGFYLCTRGLTGYGFGRIKEMIFKNNYLYHILIIGCLSLLLRLLCGLSLLWLSGDWASAFAAYGRETAGYCLGNMLLAAPVFWCMERLRRWVAEEDVTYPAEKHRKKKLER